jgi:Protein of unknown function (DUF1236)
MNHTLKHTLMITASVTALMAAGGLASAQGMNEHREQPAAAAPEQKAPQGKVEQQKPNTPQKADALKPAPTAQAPENKMNQKSDAPQKAEAVKPAPTAQAPGDKTNQKPNAPQKAETVKPAPTGQRSDKPSAVETSGQGGTQPSPRNAQTTPSERAAPNAAAQAESKPAAALSTEQHAKIRETIRGEKVAPVTGTHFSLSIGEAVPRTVRLHRLPNQIIVYAPQYRGYEYILVGDVILIVNPRTMRIVAAIPA